MLHLSTKWAVVASAVYLGSIACQPAPAAPPAPLVTPTAERVLLGLCGSNPCPAPPSPYEVTVLTSPSPMAFMHRTTFTLQVKDPAGKSLQDVTVILFATHTEDIHEDVGPVQAEHVAESTFRGQLILRKKGNYNVTVTLHGPSGEGEHVFYLDTEY